MTDGSCSIRTLLRRLFRGDQTARMIASRGDQTARMIASRGDQNARMIASRGDQNARMIAPYRTLLIGDKVPLPVRYAVYIAIYRCRISGGEKIRDSFSQCDARVPFESVCTREHACLHEQMARPFVSGSVRR